MKRTLLVMFALVAMVTAVAQNNYRVEIRQVFPRHASIYSGVFNFKREMDQAVARHTPSGQGNYTIVTTTPKGSQTRTVQNIAWVQTVNGTTSYHAKRTSPATSYSSPTVWRGYACNLNGSATGQTTVREFVYRVSVKDTVDHFKTAYLEKSAALAQAQRIFETASGTGTEVCVVVYAHQGKKVTEVSRLTNAEAMAARKARQDSVAKSRQVAQAVEQLKDEMNRVRLAIDTLGNGALTACRRLLERSSATVNDSVLVSEGLDALCLTVLAQSLANADRRDLLALLPDSALTTSDLIALIGVLETKIAEPSPTPPAYERELVGAKLIEHYTFEGDSYEYYECPKSSTRKKKTHLLVNKTTHQYEIGEFEPVRKPNNELVLIAPKPGKTRRYDRDGNSM